MALTENRTLATEEPSVEESVEEMIAKLHAEIDASSEVTDKEKCHGLIDRIEELLTK